MRIIAKNVGLSILAGLFLFLLLGAETRSAYAQEPSVDSTATSDSPVDENQDKIVTTDVSSASAETVVRRYKSTTDSNLPIIALLAGVSTILVLMIVFRVHAFIALMLAAFVVSLFAGGVGDEYLTRVAASFGSNAGKVGIVIAMAALIGKCMLDSGSANRIVDACMSVIGVKRAPTALASAAFLLGIPVFFDTVFYLLVPLARSFYRNTKKHYLRYIVAVAAGGAVTHTLVPPTPGPLFIATSLDVNLGLMILMGGAVGFPCAVAGLLFARFIDLKMPIEMRPLSTEDLEPPQPKNPPTLFWALLPIVLPVLLISIYTVLSLAANGERAAAIAKDDVDVAQLRAELTKPENQAIANHLLDLNSAAIGGLLASDNETLSDEDLTSWNTLLEEQSLYSDKLFGTRELSESTLAAANSIKPTTHPAIVQHANRLLLEDLFGSAIASHKWETAMRQWANWFSLPGSPNFALILAAFVSMFVLWRSQQKSMNDLSQDMEFALLSGAVIILITAAGGAFGEMLRLVNISEWVQSKFSNATATGVGVLLLAWTIAATLKLAQGSSTVAMISTSGMIGAILENTDSPVNMVYVATAIGSGSLMGSWMNDSGFWIFSKMGGLTEGETLRSWTVLLGILSLVGLLATILYSQLIPMH